MSEWWTYSLSDFLMFSARTYYRQFELMNREWWPLHLLALGAGGAILACMLRPRSAGARIAFALLALAWLWTGWAYHLERYADINTGAPYFAAGFLVQALLLAWAALKYGSRVPAAGLPAGFGSLCMLLALAYPVLAALAGRSWWQAETFAIAPDPTALATFGALLCWRAPWLLWVLPLLWCAVSSATLAELHVRTAWMPLAGGLLALAAGIWSSAVRKRAFSV
ncbi:DUF6064 family protein [Massilia sp. IC2-476]|uniref:DUF6064 family protein n=1 Tax=Massilia sp. IC2-476 TaxID=2887199 RepID=UPI001D10CE0A|nr:DUF6064 family protein [Massilia sp. IC2-476]MCC2973418.1 DUF6064 family protein [Massilia sp. IC2-476]